MAMLFNPKRVAGRGLWVLLLPAAGTLGVEFMVEKDLEQGQDSIRHPLVLGECVAVAALMLPQ